MMICKNWGIIFFILLACFGMAFAVENDYLEVSGQPKLTHTEKINSGDPYAAEMTLLRVGIIPRETSLNVSTGAVNPIIKINVDGSEQTFTSQSVVLDLSETGVSRIDIEIRGNAPTVTTDTAVKVVSVNTYAIYDDVNKGTQEEVVRTIIVTNPEIEEAVRAIAESKSRLLEAETAIADLKSQGLDTGSLQTRLEIARDNIGDAEISKNRGFPIEAKRQADNAILSLDSIISDATTRTRRVVDIKNYGIVAVVIIIAIIGISVLRRKREELG